MRHGSTLALGLVALLAARVASGCPEDAAPGAEETAAAKALFLDECARCHAPPDPAFAVDRAWLEQVRSTA